MTEWGWLVQWPRLPASVPQAKIRGRMPLPLTAEKLKEVRAFSMNSGSALFSKADWILFSSVLRDSVALSLAERACQRMGESLVPRESRLARFWALLSPPLWRAAPAVQRYLLEAGDEAESGETRFLGG
jgi:hypothetical protein